MGSRGWYNGENEEVAKKVVELFRLDTCGGSKYAKMLRNTKMGKPKQQKEAKNKYYIVPPFIFFFNMFCFFCLKR